MPSELPLHPTRAYLSSALSNLHDDSKARVLALNSTIKKAFKTRLGVEVYLPQDFANPSQDGVHEDGLSSEEVYLLDRWRVSEADFLIVNADNPSFGVGQEVEMAGALGTPLLVFHRQGTYVSRMLKGALGVYVPPGDDPQARIQSIMRYSEEEDLVDQLTSRAKQLTSDLDPRDKIQSWGMEEAGQAIRQARKDRGLTVEALARMAGISAAFLEMIEDGKERPRKVIARAGWPLNEISQTPDMRFTNPGLWVLGRIAHALDISTARLLGMEDRFASTAGDQFLSLCRKHGVSFGEAEELGEVFEIQVTSNLLAARTGPPSEEMFLKHLAGLRDQ